MRTQKGHGGEEKSIAVRARAAIATREAGSELPSWEGLGHSLTRLTSGSYDKITLTSTWFRLAAGRLLRTGAGGRAGAGA